MRTVEYIYFKKRDNKALNRVYNRVVPLVSWLEADRLGAGGGGGGMDLWLVPPNGSQRMDVSTTVFWSNL